MLTKFLEKEVIWVKFRNIYKKIPTETLTCYFHISNENYKKMMNKDSGMNSNHENIDLDEKQLPEEPTTCCMSGCANCVWLEYAEKMSEHFKDGGTTVIKEINEKVNDPNIRAFLLQELRMRKL